MKIKALALDLDGTVLRPGPVLSDYTIKILKSCTDRGIKLILCTGRAAEGAERFRLAIGAEGPMVYFNGAEVMDMPQGRILHTLPLGLDVVDYCTDLSRNMGAYFQVFVPPRGGSKWESLITERAGSESEMYYKHTGITPVIDDIKHVIAAPGVTGAIKCMFIAEQKVQDEIRPRLLERFSENGGIYVAQTFPTFLEIMAFGVSKGEGLKIALENLGLGAEEVIAMGDEENDLPLFTAAGFSVAPANAKEKVRAAADLVVGSNAEDGPAVFLERLFLR
jgi:Cof subfamily protein (haloacid dehalogenase superfamily)